MDLFGDLARYRGRLQFCAALALSGGFGGCASISSVELDDMRMISSDGELEVEVVIEKDRVLNWSAVEVEASVRFRHVEIVEPIDDVSLSLTVMPTTDANRRIYQGRVDVPVCASHAAAVARVQVTVGASRDQPRPRERTASLVLARHVTSRSSWHPDADRLLHVAISDRSTLVQSALQTGASYTYDVRLACVQDESVDVAIEFGASCNPISLPGPTPPVVATATATPSSVTVPAGADRATFTVSNIAAPPPVGGAVPVLTTCGSTLHPDDSTIFSDQTTYCAATQMLTSAQADRCAGLALTD